MTPKQQAMYDYQSGEFCPDAPSDFSEEEKQEYYDEFNRLCERDSK